MDKKPIRHFMIIDQEKNILLVPSSNTHLTDAIHSARSSGESVITNETMGELVANVKRYLKGEFENGNN